MSTDKLTKGEATRQRLIETALYVLSKGGVHGLTLDGVAQKAAISKGGLLHHFRTKDELIEALLHHLFGDFTRRVEAHAEAEGNRPGRWLRAYVRATFEEDALPLELATMLLTAVTDHPKLLDLIREDAAFWQQRLLGDGVPAARATVVRQAADAYWVDRLIGTASSDAATLASIRDELLQLTEVNE